MDFISLQPYVLKSLASLGGLSAFTYVLVFLGGVASALSPCYSPILIMFGAYTGGYAGGRKTAALSIAVPFIAGTVITLSLFGVVAGIIGSGIMTTFTGLSLDRYIPGLLGLVMGFQLLGVFRLRIPVFRGFALPKATGSGQAFAFGLPFGLVITPCTVPIFITVLGLAVGRGGIVSGLTVMAAYALGRGLLLLAVGIFASVLSIFRNGRWLKLLEKLSGVVILLSSLYILFIR